MDSTESTELDGSRLVVFVLLVRAFIRCSWLKNVRFPTTVRGSANFVVRWPGQNRQASISLLEEKYCSEEYPADKSGEFVAIAAFECRGRNDCRIAVCNSACYDGLIRLLVFVFFSQGLRSRTGDPMPRALLREARVAPPLRRWTCRMATGPTTTQTTTCPSPSRTSSTDSM